MSDLSINPVQTDHLQTSVALRGKMVHVVCRGTADQQAVDWFADFFSELQKEVDRLEIQEVVFDFRQLEFLSASCFKRFAWWLEEVRQSANPQFVRFLSNSSYMWQRFSLNALAAFGEGRVAVAEVE